MLYIQDKTVLCIIENIYDLLAIEQNKIYHEIYHNTLYETLYRIEGIGPKNLNFDDFQTKFNISQII